MSNTELSTIDQDELNALNAEMGMGADDLVGGGDFIPTLKINYEDDDDDDNAPKLKGKFFIVGMETPVYAKTVEFRALTHTFQWTDYDKVAEKVVNKTRLIPNFQEEARDEKGTLKCGKPGSKEIKANPALKEQFESITCYRTVQGYVSYTGIDKDGNTVEVPETLVSLRMKGANFGQYEEEFLKLLPAKSQLYNFRSVITPERKKNGTATYFVLHFDTDFSKVLQITPPIFADLKGLKARIDAFNKGIDEKYYSALRGAKEDTKAADAIKTVSSGRPGANRNLSQDMDDDIPF